MILDKFLDKLSAREKAGLFVAVLAIVAVLADWLVVRPMFKTLQTLDDKAVISQRELLLSDGALRMEGGVATAYVAVSEQLDDASSVADLREQIGELAKKNGIELPSMEDQAPIKGAGVCVDYPVEVTKVETDVASLLRFMHAVNAAPGLLRVSKVSLTPSKEPKRLQCSMTITKTVLPASAAGAPEEAAGEADSEAAPAEGGK